MSLLDRARTDGLLRFSGEGRSEKVTYTVVGHSERWIDPEEKVRAEFYAELVYRYGYPVTRIGLEIIVPDRTPKDAADIVVFRDDKRTEPYAVIECKRDGVSDAEFAQAIEQACGNGTWAKFRATYVGVVAGSTRRFLDFTEKYGVLEREANIVADLPREYGKPQEFKYRKGVSDQWEDIRPVNKEDLIAAIRKCHQTLWGGGRLSPPIAFGELCKLIFVKVRDELSPRKRGEPYQFQIKTHESSTSLASRIRSLYREHQEREPDVFTETIKIDDATLRTVVSHLESINLNKTDLDTKGVAFEQFMDGFFKGDFGQYFTPRELIAFCVELLDPTNSDLILDPACGSGGFLLYALDHVRREAESLYADDQKEQFRHWHDFAQKNLYGIEINDEIARVAKMNMILHDDGHTNIVGADALDAFEKLSLQNPKLVEERFDLVLTNPPFGAMVKESERGKGYLDQWELARYISKQMVAEPENGDRDPKLGRKVLKQKTSVKTEILFCERVWQFLKPGGRAAIVLPDGILTNSSLLGVREWLMERFQVLAVTSLPPGAFAHFGAGVKASLVFLRKRAHLEMAGENEAIFMAAPDNIGYDATGRRTFKVVAVNETARLRTEIHRSDLYDVEIDYELSELASTGETVWVEKRRRILPDTGLLGQYKEFLKNPEPYLV
jgi:type I restriction enzyme M protein